MYIFSEVAKIFRKMNPAILLSRVFAMPEIKEELINTILLRLEKKGITASGEKLVTDSAFEQDLGKVYSVFNEEKSENTIVDLKVTGEFYDSFEVESGKSEFTILAQFKKDGEHIADNFTHLFEKSDFESEIMSPVFDEYFAEFAKEDLIPVFLEVVEEFFVNNLTKIKPQ